MEKVDNIPNNQFKCPFCEGYFSVITVDMWHRCDECGAEVHTNYIHSRPEEDRLNKEIKLLKANQIPGRCKDCGNGNEITEGILCSTDFDVKTKQDFCKWFWPKPLKG